MRNRDQENLRPVVRPMHSDGIHVPPQLTESGEGFLIPRRSWFEELREPTALLGEAMRCNHALRADVFFSKRVQGVNIDYLQDAITAGEFAGLIAHTYPCEVALVSEQQRFPDFRILFHDPSKRPSEFEFESVWADEKSRRVKEEYSLHYDRQHAWNRERQAVVAAGQPDPGDYTELEEYSPFDEEEKAREAIPRVVADKAAKGYSRSTRLVVRNNVGTLSGLEYSQLTKAWHDHFAEIWILKAPLLLRIHPNVQWFGDPAKWPLP